jgi:hypothetical protein
VELIVNDGVEFGQGVDPGEQGLIGFAVGEAEIELVAEGSGETGKFAEHGDLILRFS